MFDNLLDEFEAAADQSTEAMTGGFRKLPVDDNEDNNVAVAMAEQAEGEVQLDSPDELLAGDETETWSDDPVRMYLTQMGEIPLLTRKQEIELAKRIEETRRRFRTKLLENHFVLVEAYKTLKKVYRGQLPFDRTVQVSVTDRLEKERPTRAVRSRQARAINHHRNPQTSRGTGACRSHDQRDRAAA